LDCSNNELISIEGAPKKVERGFLCDYNELTSLKGAPKEVKGGFWCNNNIKVFTVEEVEAVSIVGKGIYPKRETDD